MAELPEGVRALYDAANYATVTTLNPDGSPQSSVVWVKSDGDDILFSTTKGRRKHRNYLSDPRTSLLVINPENPFSYAEVRGTVTMVDDPEGKLIEELSRKYTGKAWEEAEGNERVIVRVRVDRAFLRG